MFFLTQHTFFSSRSDNDSFTEDFDKGLRKLVCHEYLRTIEKEPENGDRLLKVAELLGDRCRLHSNDFAKSSEFQWLLCLLERLSSQRIIQLGLTFAGHLSDQKKPGYPQQQYYWYFLGFWLIERLEDTGIDPTGTLNGSLKTGLLNYYQKELEANLAGHRRSLEPNAFFSTLPWHKLIGHEGVGPLLALSNSCSEWQQSLNYSNENSTAVASAARHYLLVLMCVGDRKDFPWIGSVLRTG